MPTPTLYTLGYTGWSLKALQAVLEAKNAALVDIRFAPRSRNPAYNKAHLQATLGERYVHLQALGNRHYKGGPIAIVDYAHGLRTIAELLPQWGAVILLCVCADVTTCHRKGVGEQLSADLGVPLEHLARPSPPAASQLTLGV